MAKLLYALSQSLDGYVDHTSMPPDLAIFRYFCAHERALTGSLYGRRVYEILRYWDEDRPEWGADEREFAAVWRGHPKWVVSGTLKAVGPNATLLGPDLEAEVRALKANHEGTIAVAGPELAGGLTRLGLIDEYQLVLRPFVVGEGTPYFTGPRPPLRLTGSERIGDAIGLTYVPA